MGNPNTEPHLLSRVSNLLNNPKFSDVEFQVKNAHGGFTSFFAHKLILSIAGDRFAEFFYNARKPVPSMCIFKVHYCTPSIFALMLKYLYHDTLELTDLEDATDLFRLAKRHKIRDLMDKCVQFITQYDVNLDTLFAKYEYAIADNFEELLLICRKLVCTETEAVFNHRHFCDASLDVISDILKLDRLSVPSELKVLYAAMEWCKSECSRKGRPTDDNLALRDTFLKLCRYLRFLTLDYTDIYKFTDRYEEVLTDVEKSLLVSVLLKDKTVEDIPNTFCLSSIPRTPLLLQNNSHIRNSTSRVNKTGFSNMSRYNSLDSSQRDPNSYLLNDIFMENSPQQSVASAKSTKYDVPIFQFSTSNKTHSSVSKVIPKKIVNKLRNFDFPLQKMQEDFKCTFSFDIKCNVEIKMLQGSVFLHEIELKVSKTKHQEEDITVHWSLSGNDPIDDTEKLKLKNNRLVLSFAQPMLVSSRNPVEIEVIIDDLKLNRCDICQEPLLELNCGLDVRAILALKSNRPNGTDGFIFLISRIVYSLS